MRGCDFSHCSAIEISFENAHLMNCNFNDMVLKSANMRQAIVSKSTFIGTNLIGADLMRLVAKDCNFSKSRLQKADMREADFENSNFNEASLFEANLERANL